MLTKVIYVLVDNGTITKFGFSGVLPAVQDPDGKVHFAGQLTAKVPFHWYNGSDICGIWPDASALGGWRFSSNTVEGPLAHVAAIDIEAAFREIAFAKDASPKHKQALELLAHYGF